VSTLRLGASLGLTLAVSLGCATAAGAAVPQGNVLRNAGADAAAGGNDASAQVTIPEWAATGTFTAVAYGAPGGFPDAAVAGVFGGGANFFAGGRDSATATGTQDVAVSSAASDIDAGSVKAVLSGQLGGFQSQGDATTVTATWLDAAGNPVGTPLTIGPVTPADRANVTTLLPRSASATVPAATRSARVVISAVRTNGSYNDGYADSIGLELSGGALPPAAKVITFPPAKTCSSRRNFQIHLRQPNGLKIASAAVFVNGKRVKVVRGTRVTAPVNLQGLPKGRFIVRIEVTTADGRTLKGSRAYRTCTKKRASTGPRL